jgi:hypothetical protein
MSSQESNSPSNEVLSSKHLPAETTPANLSPQAEFYSSYPNSSTYFSKNTPTHSSTNSPSTSQIYLSTNSHLTHFPHTSTLPLEFHRHILEELLSEDGLLILSRGLGLRRIICALLRIYSNKESLVILLNASGHELSCIKEEIAEYGVRKPGLRVINNETNSKER